MSFFAMRNPRLDINISDSQSAQAGQTTHNTRSNPLGEWIGMAWRMPIGTSIGLLISFLDIAYNTRFKNRYIKPVKKHNNPNITLDNL